MEGENGLNEKSVVCDDGHCGHEMRSAASAQSVDGLVGLSGHERGGVR
ncbi:MAG: hypothetical protein R3242_11800 [Akkermansiaceae bacterium]|nr:hypothetical protein [Akkermansiaceae bacterium]